MRHKVFVSYKYADNTVGQLQENPYWNAFFPNETVRNFVSEFESQCTGNDIAIYKGESDGEDLSQYSEDYIWSKLRDRIYDSSITAIFISPNMKEQHKTDRSQWIPWEVAFSLRESSRKGRTSYSNALICVVLPDIHGRYDYVKTMPHFGIVRQNIQNNYAYLVTWGEFIKNIPWHLECALRNKTNFPSWGNIVKTV